MPHGLVTEEVITIRIQPLPVPDEAPLTSCPHCGKEYLVKEEGPEETYEQIEGIPCIARHKPCGGLVRMVCWADDLTFGPCKLGLRQNDVGECGRCPHRTRDFD